MFTLISARMRSALLLTFAFFGATVSCRDVSHAPPRMLARDMIAAHISADSRPDSFTHAADVGRIAGDTAAPVWLIIVSDFQCGACKQWHDEVYTQIRSQYVETGRVRMAYVNMPLAAHLNGVPTALAAGCASAQGKFWETHDRIFETQQLWIGLPDARPYLDSLAIATGVDAATQRTCTERARAMKLIRQDEKRSKAAGVDSLPTFFIGTHKLVGRSSIGTFRAVLDSALAGK